MSALGTVVLVYGFSALLPPIPEDEVSYYEILEVETSCSQDDIRKAYKKKSLLLHPDKVAQRGGDPEEAKAHYQKVQEANHVLKDPSKRRKYDMLGKSPTRYQYVSNGVNPGAMYENLAHASVCDKTKLVMLVTLLMGLILLQPILICAKINQTVEMSGSLQYTKWTLILIPWWILYGMVVMISFIVACVTRRVVFVLSFLENASWFAGMFLLALRWDDTITYDYVLVFIPIYVALFFRFAGKVVRLRDIRSTLQRMVTMEYIEREVLDENRQYNDLTEEERAELHENYVIVHVPPSASSVEEERVEASPEYQHAVESYGEIFNSLIIGIVVWTSFVALVVAKVDNAIQVSWWVVFVPIWVSLGFTILGSCYTCCCMSVVGEEVVVEPQEEQADNYEKSKDEQKQEEERQKASGFVDVEASIKISQNASSQDASDIESGKGSMKEELQTSSSAQSEPKKEDASRDEKPSYEPPILVEPDKQEAKESEDDPTPASEPRDTPAVGDHDFFVDEDVFREWEEARQEAEASVMEAQAKAQANCCAALFQLTIVCLIVGKLQQDYQRPPNEEPGYSAFWILFPVFVVMGCALCSCCCLIYGAGESEGFDHMMERRMSTTKSDEEEGDEEAPKPTEETGASSKEEDAAPAAATGDEEIHDLD